VPKKLQKGGQFIKSPMLPNSVMNSSLYHNISCPQMVFFGDLMLCPPVAIEVAYPRKMDSAIHHRAGVGFSMQFKMLTKGSQGKIT